MPVGQWRFKPATTIQADGASAPVLTGFPSGWAIAYVHDTPGGPRPALQVTDGHIAFGPVRYAAPAQAGLRGADLTFTPVGGLVVAWVQPVDGQDGDGVARAAAVPAGIPGAAFGPVEDVSPAEAVHEVRLADDSRAGQPVAVWTARPGGTGPGVALAQLRTLVRSAARLP